MIANPLLLQWVVDHALVTASTRSLDAARAGVRPARAARASDGRVARSWIVLHFETTLNVQWHANVFAHLLRLPLPYFEKRHLGDIVSRFRSIDAIQRTVTTAFIEADRRRRMSALVLLASCSAIALA